MMNERRLKLLYHGTSSLIVGEIKPHVSFDYHKYVYATDDYAYALVRCGRFDIHHFLLKEDYEGSGKPIRLIELEPRAFEKTFDADGYIYTLSPSLFVRIHPNEFVCEIPVPYVNRIRVENVWLEMLRHPEWYDLLRFEDSSSYWESVRGGMDGYLMRRKERVRKLDELNQNWRK